MHFLLNHPNLRDDIVEVLKSRQHDVDENVRYEVVLAVVTTAKHDFEIVSQSTELLDCVKERTLDKKVWYAYKRTATVRVIPFQFVKRDFSLPV